MRKLPLLLGSAVLAFSLGTARADVPGDANQTGDGSQAGDAASPRDAASGSVDAATRPTTPDASTTPTTSGSCAIGFGNASRAGGWMLLGLGATLALVGRRRQ